MTAARSASQCSGNGLPSDDGHPIEIPRALLLVSDCDHLDSDVTVRDTLLLHQASRERRTMSLTAIMSQHEEDHLMQATSEQVTTAESHGATPSRYYQVVFIWMKDPVTFGRYAALVEPVVRPYGGGLERRLIPNAIYAEGMPKPDIVNIVFCDSRAAFAAFEQDPEFAKIVHLRSG